MIELSHASHVANDSNMFELSTDANVEYYTVN